VIRYTLAAVAVAAALLSPHAARAQNSTTLTYVGMLGDTRMGTQTFTITATGKPDSYAMQGKVDLNFNYKLLLISYHIINQSNYTETWEGGKLVSFRGTTRDRDDNYAIEYADGKVTAAKNKDKPQVREVPPTVASASFWLESYFMKQPHPFYISTNSGKVKTAKAPKMEGQQTVTFRNQQVKVNYWTMDFDGDKYEFWYLADSGLLLKRVEPSEGGKVTFTLQ
jgi:hypothetical protein